MIWKVVVIPIPARKDHPPPLAENTNSCCYFTLYQLFQK